MLDYFRSMNAAGAQDPIIRADFGQALAKELSTRKYVGWWEVRNLRMVANIRAAIGDRPGAVG